MVFCSKFTLAELKKMMPYELTVYQGMHIEAKEKEKKNAKTK